MIKQVLERRMQNGMQLHLVTVVSSPMNDLCFWHIELSYISPRKQPCGEQYF